MKTLLFLSGGLDSVCALVKLLRETGDTLAVHHMHLQNREGRDQAERQAVDRIVLHCMKKFRNFSTQTTTHRFTGVCCPTDMHVVRFVAAMVCRAHRFDRVVTGRCGADTGPGYEGRLRTATAIFDAAMGPSKRKPEWYYPVKDMSKAAEIAYLREHCPEILPWIHYCRRPRQVAGQWVNCERCHTCRQTARADFEFYRLRCDGTPKPDRITQRKPDAKRTRQSLPCVYLGKPTGEFVRCPSCKGNVKLKVYGCEMHGKCLIGSKTSDGIRCCSKCSNRQDRPDHAEHPAKHPAEQTP